MKEKLSAGDIIDRLAKRAGITKKLSADLVRALPEIIEKGLYAESEAKVRGLGTFRLKTVAPKKGRNPKTGEEVIIPSHQKLIFLPEESFKEQVNEEYRFLGIKVLEEEPVRGSQFAVRSSQSTPSTPVSGILEPGTLETPEVSGQRSKPVQEQPVATTKEEATALVSSLADDELRTQNSELKTQNSELSVKRRNYWLIPVIILIVAVLSVVFYWRNFYTGSQFAVRSSQPEQTQEKPAATTQEEAAALDSSSVSGQRSAVVSPEPETQNPELNEQVPEPKPQNLNLNTTLPTTTVGTHLFQLAREAYGNPFLWVLIYRANLDEISDPDLAVIGEDIVIPALEGTPKKLSHNDSLAVSDGYRLVYEFYLSKGDARAEDFRMVMVKYKPK
jgi:integration host factor subunit alpha